MTIAYPSNILEHLDEDPIWVGRWSAPFEIEENFVRLLNVFILMELTGSRFHFRSYYLVGWIDSAYSGECILNLDIFSMFDISFLECYVVIRL